MEKIKDIERLQTELKGFDVSSLGRSANDKKANKGELEKRKICLLNAFKNLQNIEKIRQKQENEEIEEKEEAEEYRDPLSIEKQEVFDINLSTGGGADGFKLFFQNNELIKGVYYMADWGEYKKVYLNEEEAEEIYGFYMFGDVESFKQ